ncbi:MAG: hypothetical protein IJL52_01975 [Clostridia bacterium]|nr:hypothetical protein [Clostridia bacterium]
MAAELKNRIKGRPEFIRAAETDDGAVFLAWRETPGAQKYIIEKYNWEIEHFRRYAAVPGDTMEFVDTDVEPGRVYRYRINAKRKNPGGEVLSRRGMMTSVSTTSKDTVLLTEAQHPAFGQAKLTWQPAPDVDGYCVNRRPAEVSKPLPLAYVDQYQTGYLDRTCISGQIYFYSVQSFRQYGDDELIYSQVGNEKRVVNLDTPQILSIKKHGRTAQFKVRVTAGADGYLLLRADTPDGPFTEAARTDSGTTLTLTDRGGRSHGGCYYAVCCYKKYEGEELHGPATAPQHV